MFTVKKMPKEKLVNKTKKKVQYESLHLYMRRQGLVLGETGKLQTNLQFYNRGSGFVPRISQLELALR